MLQWTGLSGKTKHEEGGRDEREGEERGSEQ